MPPAFNHTQTEGGHEYESDQRHCHRNVTTILCDRLRDNNILVEQQYLILEDLAEQE